MGTVLHLIYLKLLRPSEIVKTSLGTVLHLIYLKHQTGELALPLCLGTVLHLIYLKLLSLYNQQDEQFGYCVTFDISQTGI